ncbi:epoxide hydrolase [Rhodococcus sp. G-MC3]|uniref:epoxide hydrolase family protein n=1 Tax=Rhodococcus sp. G-MC3 TaxID=3046209 RepID=UPI0024B99081|nr:epoxide hydrolase [Rhodococcus sp. G-MC3]MDJ0394048.1 epoxide hydrolase [Rhodococcus sp. G-MC3]
MEKQLASFPQYMVEIDGQRIHYLHVRSSRADSTPVLLCHGWPGSYLEFLDLIPLLTEPDNAALQVFDVIVPSVPGFAFSTPLSGDGWSTDRVAQALVELMSFLGYGSYVVQGGDYSAGVAPAVGRLDPQHCDAIHVNGSISIQSTRPQLIGAALTDSPSASCHGCWTNFGRGRIRSTRNRTVPLAATGYSPRSPCIG